MINYDTYRIFRNKKDLTDCNPQIVNDSIFATNDFEYINELDLAERCKCNKIEICKDLLFALRNKDKKRVENLLAILKNNG